MKSLTRRGALLIAANSIALAPVPGHFLATKKNYPWLPPPESSRTMEPTKLLASPKSIRVLSM